MGEMNCKNCGERHIQSDRNCCWINCSCGKTICGMCGYAGEQWVDCFDGSDEERYWCCRECPECGLQGCAMCI